MERLTFNGSDYNHERDSERLTSQYQKIFQLMQDGIFRTLIEIERDTKCPAPSISAQLRHMRKKRFGSHTINKKYLGEGLYKYQLVINKQNG